MHPNGEKLQWEQTGDPAAVNLVDLQRRVARLAAATLIARHWPRPGSRHEAANALAGVLLRANWSESETDSFIVAVAQCAGDEEHADRTRSVRSTATRLADDEAATGRPRLAALTGLQIVNLRANGSKSSRRLRDRRNP